MRRICCCTLKIVYYQLLNDNSLILGLDRKIVAEKLDEAPQQTNTPNSNAVPCLARYRREIIPGKTDRPTPMIDRLAYLIQKSKDEDK